MKARNISPQELLERARQYLPSTGVALVERALEFASRCHQGQFRRSGDPAITHPLHTAYSMAELQLDAETVAAALLHDVQEDCGIPNQDLRQLFGEGVASLVEGVTKLGQIPWETLEDRAAGERMQAENLRKMFLAMARDLRVVLIKLADRLHNMLTLYALPREDQVRIARETLEIYAPLAARLGIWQFKWQLEDLAFRYLEPDKYRAIADMLATKREARQRYINHVCRLLQEELSRHGLSAQVQGRAKHIYSIYQKMQRYAAEGRNPHEIYDLLAVRILVDSVPECYRALGIVHSIFTPLPGTFDDYIAKPKQSMYQSLHTTVMGPGGRPLEVQIRTHEMHQVAEYGVAAHWRYKEGEKPDRRYQERLAWLRQLLQWHQEMAGAQELVEAIKSDIFQDQVFVFTPKGEVKELPRGATPIDFAYRIHTDLGHRCVGAKVNGRLVPLNYQLQNGDVVEIIVSKTAKGPSRDWLNPELGYVHTSHARQKIRQWFKRQERAENVARGREMLLKELSRLGLELAQVEGELVRAFGLTDVEELFFRLGYGELSPHQVLTRIPHLLEPPPQAPHRPRHQPLVSAAGVRVLGSGDLLTRLARCCQPMPGDPIVGYVSRGEGVSVHRTDCPNLPALERERLVEVEWGAPGHVYPVAVRIDAWDRVGLMRDISTLVAEEGVNMTGIRSQEHDDGTITIYVTLETQGLSQLIRLLAKLEGVRGVTAVKRELSPTARGA
ncbi:MAG: bifunctional (p)ppGpp synthetase/guanosine-3',5'-bis(diphosphate) 3'-pyrophosphohydrolase [Dehalococcoidia bacterium]|nr:bifunctional (p)ppGpp synthetase/guanosine-3',5'-bis(diphosphate) 3'-pyrophosphohydrolase [Dehalococcoidia bacterium]